MVNEFMVSFEDLEEQVLTDQLVSRGRARKISTHSVSSAGADQFNLEIHRRPFDSTWGLPTSLLRARSRF